VSNCILASSALLISSCSQPPAAARTDFTATHAIVVTTSGTGAAEAGIEVLRRGGTAMDAAMTAALLQPCLTAGHSVSYAGILALVYFDAASGKVYNLDAGFNTVRGEKDPLTIPGPATASGRTALVPGFLAGVEAGHARFGKLPFADLVAPAIRCAEQGFEYTVALDRMTRRHAAVLDRLPETKAIFEKPDGDRFATGETFRQPALAQTLRAIAKQGVREHIYRGTWAQALVAAVQRDGGHMTLEDLESYEPVWSNPVQGQFNGYDVYAFGRPSRYGPALIEALNLASSAHVAQMRPYDRDPHTLRSMLKAGLLAELLESGTAISFENALGLDLTPGSRLEQSTANSLWVAMQAGRIPQVRMQSPSTAAHTAAVVAVDAQGNVAALVHTINTMAWGGTGIFVGGISIPDPASFQQQLVVQFPHGSRLPATIAPGIALKNGKPVLGFGATGNFHMRSFAAVVSVLGHGMTPQQAINAPSIGGFMAGEAASDDWTALVGDGELDDSYIDTLRDLGLKVNETDLVSGNWIGVSIDPGSGTLRAGTLRDLDAGGTAAGY
jgi:gamma-glutamyltranspeptidase / glutathione hydrolase